MGSKAHPKNNNMFFGVPDFNTYCTTHLGTIPTENTLAQTIPDLSTSNLWGFLRTSGGISKFGTSKRLAPSETDQARDSKKKRSSQASEVFAMCQNCPPPPPKKRRKRRERNTNKQREHAFLLFFLRTKPQKGTLVQEPHTPNVSGAGAHLDRHGRGWVSCTDSVDSVQTLRPWVDHRTYVPSSDTKADSHDFTGIPFSQAQPHLQAWGCSKIPR